MGDDSRPLSSGDRWRPTAAGLNTLQRAAEEVENQKRGGGSLADPKLRRELGTVVRVKNADTGQKNWSLFSPVVVKVPGGAPASRALGFAANPHFTGNWPTGSNLFSPGDVLGVTQEPIPYGRTGRVCIAGPTCALALDESSMTGQTYVQAKWEQSKSRLVWERAVWGQARVLFRLDNTKYQDCVYNDRYFFLIDLDPGPQRLWAKLNGDLKGTSETGTYGYATATVWNRPSKTAYWQETQTTLTAYAPPFLGEDETIKAGNWVMLEYVPLEWLWYVVATTGEVLTECMP